MRKLLDHAFLVGIVAAVALLSRLPLDSRPELPVSAADAYPGAWMRLVIDGGTDPSYLFHMQAVPGGGAYETRMTFEGRSYVLRGTVADAELRRFMRGLEAHRTIHVAELLGPVARRSPRYTLFLRPNNGQVAQITVDDAWSPQYQSLQRYLDRSIVGRSQEALRKAAGF